MNTEELTHKVDELHAQLAYLVERQKKQEELIEEMMPILKGAMSVASERLSRMEDKGYFAFTKESAVVLDRIVTGFSPDEVSQLGDNIVQILRTVKSVSQPQMLSIAQEATRAISENNNEEPVGLLGMLKAGRDKDVQHGMATVLSVLRHVGRYTERLSRSRTSAQEALQARIGPRASKGARSDDEGPLAPSRPSAKPTRNERPMFVQSSASKTGFNIPGVELDAEGFMKDATQWNEEVAVRIARAVGIQQLTESHWRVLRFAREEHERTSKSPNIRRLTKGSGLSTKEIYALFLKAPGKAAARIAGLPKPVGCI